MLTFQRNRVTYNYINHVNLTLSYSTVSIEINILCSSYIAFSVLYYHMTSFFDLYMELVVVINYSHFSMLCLYEVVFNGMTKWWYAAFKFSPDGCPHAFKVLFEFITWTSCHSVSPMHGLWNMFNERNSFKKSAWMCWWKQVLVTQPLSRTDT